MTRVTHAADRGRLFASSERGPTQSVSHAREYPPCGVTLVAERPARSGDGQVADRGDGREADRRDVQLRLEHPRTIGGREQRVEPGLVQLG